MNITRQRRPSQGFTLIELLVVIAIIAILAAILFPVFAKAREKARQTACLSNTKQLALGIVQYEQDFDEKCPNGANPFGGGEGWAGEIYPYVKSTGVFACPDDATVNSVANAHMSSYGYNSQVVIQSPTAPAGAPDSITIAQYNAPAKTVLLFEVVNSGLNGNGYDISRGAQVANGTALVGDTAGQGSSPGGFGVGGGYDPNGAGGNGGADGGTPTSLKYATGYLLNSKTGAALGDFAAATGRHTDGANYVMADGHAKWFRSSAVSGGYINGAVGQGNCGSASGPLAAATDCSMSNIAATFNYN